MLAGEGVKGENKTSIEDGQDANKKENSGDVKTIDANKVDGGDGNTGGVNAGDNGNAGGEGGKKNVTDGTTQINENGQKIGNTNNSNSHDPPITTNASTGQSMYNFF